jgi:predicted transcriptional regulator
MALGRTEYRLSKQRPGKRSVVLTATTTPEIKQRLIQLAQKSERTLSWTIEKILRDFLDSHR